MANFKDIHGNPLSLSASDILIPSLGVSLADAIAQRLLPVPDNVTEQVEAMESKVAHAVGTISSVTVDVATDDTGTTHAEGAYQDGVLAITLYNVKGDKGEALTFDDLTDEQKAELKGEKMTFADLTEEDKDELRGAKGEGGKSAYDLAVDNGFVGTETEWLVSLKGEKGDKGERGANGANGADGRDGDDGILDNVVQTIDPSDTANAPSSKAVADYVAAHAEQGGGDIPSGLANKVANIDIQLNGNYTVVPFFVEGSKNCTQGQSTVIYSNNECSIKQGEIVTIQIFDAISTGLINRWRVNVNGTYLAETLRNNSFVFMADADVNTISISASSSNTLASGKILYRIYSSGIGSKGETQKVTEIFKEPSMICTWIDDDFVQAAVTRVTSICTELDIRASFAVIPTFDTSNHAVTLSSETANALKDLQDLGYEVLMHPEQDVWNYNNGYTKSDVEANAIKTKRAFWEKGIYADYIVYPGGGGSYLENQRIASSHSKLGIGGSGINTKPTIERYLIKRVFADLTQTTKSEIKKQIDAAYAAKAWLIIGTHSWQFNDSDTVDESTNSIPNLREILNYAKAKAKFVSVESAYNNYVI